MLGTILIVILVLALIGALPRWSHSRECYHCGLSPYVLNSTLGNL
jgi:hypothetical protein